MVAKVLDLKEFAATDGKAISAMLSQLEGRKVTVTLVEDVRWANCSRNKHTKDLDQLAEFVDLVEAVKNLPPEDAHDLDCLPLLELLRVFQTAIKEDKSFVAHRFADAMDEYRDGFSRRTDEEQGIIHLLRACRILFVQHQGKKFYKKDLKAKAQLLWARTQCRAQGIGSNINDDDPRIQDRLSSLPEMNWTRLYSKIKLRGVKNGPRGPDKKGRQKR